jgi:hypothetical protein
VIGQSWYRCSSSSSRCRWFLCCTMTQLEDCSSWLPSSPTGPSWRHDHQIYNISCLNERLMEEQIGFYVESNWVVSSERIFWEDFALKFQDSLLISTEFIMFKSVKLAISIISNCHIWRRECVFWLEYCFTTYFRDLFLAAQPSFYELDIRNTFKLGDWTLIGSLFVCLQNSKLSKWE